MMNKDQLIDLLGHYLNILPSRWEGLQSYIAIYASLTSAILGIVAANIDKVVSFPIAVATAIAPIVSIVIAQFAKITIRKQNEHVRELVAFIAKLEYAIGLYDYVAVKSGSSDAPWPEDKHFLTPTWVEARYRSGANSSDFIASFSRGSAKYAYYLFSILQLISVILIVVLLLLPFVEVVPRE